MLGGRVLEGGRRVIPEGANEAESERFLTVAEVAGRMLVRVETVRRWIQEGRLQATPGPRGRAQIQESSLLQFQREAYRREHFNGIDHALHSWPADAERTSTAVVPVPTAQQAEARAPHWPFPH